MQTKSLDFVRTILVSLSGYDYADDTFAGLSEVNAHRATYVLKNMSLLKDWNFNILNIYCLTNLMTNIYSYIHELHFFRILNSKSRISQIGERSESVIIEVCIAGFQFVVKKLDKR